MDCLLPAISSFAVSTLCALPSRRQSAHPSPDFDSAQLEYIATVLVDLYVGSAEEDGALNAREVEETAALFELLETSFAEVPLTDICSFIIETRQLYRDVERERKEQRAKEVEQRRADGTRRRLDPVNVTAALPAEPPLDYVRSAGALDPDVKRRIVDRFALQTVVETIEKRTTVIPVASREGCESKRTKEGMPRYRDGQVVTTRGEKHVVEKESAEEQQRMKPTFINLKPARKYRFH